MQAPETELANTNEAKQLPPLSSWSIAASRALTRYAPALVLSGLAIFQANNALQDCTLFTTDPSWMVASELTRSVLYAAFVVGGAVALFLSKEPRSRDGRGVVIAASLIASILMIGVNFLPAGPVLWSASLHVFQVGLVLTVFGAALALTAITNLRSNFSIAPEARMLVVTGPYRILRHPIYSAELLMIVGVAIGQLRLTTLFGVLGLIGLQTFRVQREEALLRRAFPRAFEEFSARTRFRLLPLLW